ncbi:MAG: hypothetical protein AVDCRST_MAG72-2384 [uncultured Nocardioidaceae bacterium]|uniref:GCVT N-terminal domain-containing protein n=1 Tax=uncultured Nocardioidaceae bacterium TaxID=253824 RepID=A0A6J4MNY4_9ACTN|nr:MAG: hypothetical protein AVDCRST_MAG72-2384 [uncultured Nocardioidaceae bacterium]
MPETTPVIHGPVAPAPPVGVLAGWAVSRRRSGAALTLSDHSLLAKAAVKAPWQGALADVLAVPFAGTLRRTAASTELLLTQPGPGEWLVLAPPGEQTALVTWLERCAADVDELVSVLDVTHGLCLVRLTGAAAPDLLAKECALDLSERRCPDRTALRTAVSRVAADIIRDDRDGNRSYLLACERSSGQYLFDSLLDAGAEYGVEVTGFEPPGVTEQTARAD